MARAESEIAVTSSRMIVFDSSGCARFHHPVLDAGQAFTQSDVAICVMTASGGAWRLAAVARWVPRRWRDAIYQLVARNRYRWFGKRATRYLPP